MCNDTKWIHSYVVDISLWLFIFKQLVASLFSFEVRDLFNCDVVDFTGFTQIFIVLDLD